MRITEEELKERKERIVNVAYDLFCKQGIDAVSMAKIAQESKVGLNSIFRYFNNKAELANCTQKILWREIRTHILEESKERLGRTESGLEEMEILLSNFRTLYVDHKEYLLFFNDYRLFLVRHHLTMSKELHNQMLAPVEEVFMIALERGKRDGSISKRQTTGSQFLTIWDVMRGFVENLAVYSQIFDWECSWEDQFDNLIYGVLRSLKPGG